MPTPPMPTGPTVSANVAAHLAALADRRGWSGRAAFFEGHRVWTHGEVHDRAERAATVLAGRGVAAGDRVLLALPDGVMWVTAFLATARLGATAVLVNPALTADDHRFMAEDSRAALAVSGPDLQDHFEGVPWLGGDQLSALTGPPATPAPAAPAPAAEPVTAATPLYLQYTSRTTGRPKAVAHSHGDMAAYHDLVGQEVLDIGPADVSFSVSKLFYAYAYGLGNAFAFPLFSGSAAVLTADRPGPALIDGLVARHRVTLLYSVPSSYAALVDERGTGDLQCRADDPPESFGTEKAVRRWLPRLVGEDCAHRVLWVSRYHFLRKVAGSFADPSGRVLLAGEAAHLFPPFGARGMNSGIAGAVAAAEAVSAACSEPSRGPAAVAGYAAARRSAALHNSEAAGAALDHLRPRPWKRAAQRAAATLAPVVPRCGEWLERAPYGPRGGPARGY
ncbi:AMP-binding protein [Streptomyces violaceusniger]